MLKQIAKSEPFWVKTETLSSMQQKDRARVTTVKLHDIQLQQTTR